MTPVARRAASIQNSQPGSPISGIFADHWCCRRGSVRNWRRSSARASIRKPEGNSMSRTIHHALAAGGLALIGAASSASAQETVRIRGTIEKLDGPIYVVKNRDGAEVKLTV